jgi:hypothetical protein
MQAQVHDRELDIAPLLFSRHIYLAPPIRPRIFGNNLSRSIDNGEYIER